MKRLDVCYELNKDGNSTEICYVNLLGKSHLEDVG